jgi:hypothetical protein
MKLPHCFVSLLYMRINLTKFSVTFVILSGLVVIVLAIGSKVRGFKPDCGRWIFKGDKIHSMTSCGGEVKPSAPSHKILQHVKDPRGV